MKTFLLITALFASVSAFADKGSLFFQQLESEKSSIAKDFLESKLDINVASISDVTLKNKIKKARATENIDFYLGNYPEKTAYYKGETTAAVTFQTSAGSTCSVDLFIKGEINSVERGTLDLKIKSASPIECH